MLHSSVHVAANPWFGTLLSGACQRPKNIPMGNLSMRNRSRSWWGYEKRSPTSSNKPLQPGIISQRSGSLRRSMLIYFGCGACLHSGADLLYLGPTALPSPPFGLADLEDGGTGDGGVEGGGGGGLNDASLLR